MKGNLQRFTFPLVVELERELEKVHSPGRERGNLKRFTLPLVVGLQVELEKVHPSAAGKGTCKGSLSRLRSNWRVFFILIIGATNAIFFS